MRIFCGLCCAPVAALLCLNLVDIHAAPPQQAAALEVQTVSFVDGAKIKPPAPPQFILVSSGSEKEEPATAAPADKAAKSNGADRAPTLALPDPTEAAARKKAPAKSLFPPIKDSRKPKRRKQQPSPSDQPVVSQKSGPATSQPDIYLGPPPKGDSTEAAPGYIAPKAKKGAPSGNPSGAFRQPTLAEPAPELPPIEALSPATSEHRDVEGEQIEVGPAEVADDPGSLPPIRTPDVQVEPPPVTPDTLQPRPTRWNPLVTGQEDRPQIEATVVQPEVVQQTDDGTTWRKPEEFTSPAIILPGSDPDAAPSADISQHGPYIHQDENADTDIGLSPTYEAFASCAGPGCGVCWSAAVDVLALSRSPGPGVTLARNAAGATLSGNDLNPDLEIGYRGSLMMDAGDHAWQFVYLHQNWATSAGLAGNVNSVVGTTDFTGAASVLAESETTLNSIELNYLRCHHSFTPWSLGLRYVSLRDRFQLNSGAAGSRSDYRIRTNNDLFGVQAGRSINYTYGQWEFFAGAKAGLYLNSANQRVRLLDNNNTVLRRSYSDSDASVAFLGELNLMATYNIHPHVAIRGGYQVLWLEGISEAPSQFLSSSPATQAATNIDTHDGLFAHGFYGGIEFKY